MHCRKDVRKWLKYKMCIYTINPINICDIFTFSNGIYEVIWSFFFIECRDTISRDNVVSRFAVNYLFPHKIGVHSRWAKSHRVAGDWREAEQLGGARRSQYSTNRLHVRYWCPSSSDGSVPWTFFNLLQTLLYINNFV